MRSIASRYVGPARIDVADGRASPSIASRSRSRTSSGVAGSPSPPLSSMRSTGRGPREPNASRTTPSASTPHATVTEARSCPRRRVRRSWALAIRDGPAGSSTAATSSPGASVVTPERTKKSSSAIRRVPSGPATTTTARCTRSAGAVSAAGDALHRLPASVARFRIWTEPTTAAASASAARSRRITGCAAISVIVVVAPMTSPPSPVARIPGASSGTRFTSTTTDGANDPSRSLMTRSVPPASTRASPPCRTSRSTASVSVSGRAYAKGCIGASRWTRALQDPLDLVEQDLRRRGADEEERTATEPLDEGGSSRPQLVGVEQRHHVPRGEQLVGQEVVLERVEELELSLERDQLVGRRVGVAVQHRDDHEVDVGRPLEPAPRGHLAPEPDDALVRRGLVGPLRALGALAQEHVHGAHHRAAVLVDDGCLGRDLEAAPRTGLDEAHALAAVRLAAEELEGLAAVVDRRAVARVEADVLHLQREHGDDDLLERPGRPVTGERDPPAVVCHRLRAVLVPHDVRLVERGLGRHAHVREAVVEERQVVEHVVTTRPPEDVDPHAGGACRKLLGELRGGVHRVLSIAMAEAGRGTGTGVGRSTQRSASDRRAVTKCWRIAASARAPSPVRTASRIGR